MFMAWLAADDSGILTFIENHHQLKFQIKSHHLTTADLREKLFSGEIKSVQVMI